MSYLPSAASYLFSAKLFFTGELFTNHTKYSPLIGNIVNAKDNAIQSSEYMLNDYLCSSVVLLPTHLLHGELGIDFSTNSNHYYSSINHYTGSTAQSPNYLGIYLEANASTFLHEGNKWVTRYQKDPSQLSARHLSLQSIDELHVWSSLILDATFQFLSIYQLNPREIL